jgi:hypothetical protein
LPYLSNVLLEALVLLEDGLQLGLLFQPLLLVLILSLPRVMAGMAQDKDDLQINNKRLPIGIKKDFIFSKDGMMSIFLNLK